MQTLKEGHEFLVSRAAYARGGRWLATAAGDNSVRLWNAATGAQLAAVKSTPSPRWPFRRTCSSPACRTGADEHGDPAAAGPVEVFRRRAIDRTDQDRPGGAGHDHRDTVTVVAVADGKWLLFGDQAGGAKLWDAATGAEVYRLQGALASDHRSHLPAGRRQAVDRRRRRHRIAVDDPRREGRGRRWRSTHHSDAYDAPVKAMALSPKGDRLVTLSEDTEKGVLHSVVRLWDVDRAAILGELYRGPEAITSVAMAEDGRFAALTASFPFASWTAASKLAMRSSAAGIWRCAARSRRPAIDRIWISAAGPRRSGRLSKLRAMPAC